MPAPTCILVPTVERYLDAASLTTRLLERYWVGHPRIYLCGVELPGSAALPLRVDPKDWMAVVRSAVEELMQLGYERCYLVLDDHGPIARCHSRHLNETIPGWMTSLRASQISLRGWDHRRSSSGTSLGNRLLNLQRQDPAFPWRFSLHPGLWDLAALAALLDLTTASTRGGDRSAWQFEISAGRVGAQLPTDWNTRTFRVCGREMSAVRSPYLLRRLRQLRDGAIRRIDWALTRPGPDRGPLRRRLSLPVSRLLYTKAIAYEGPYPMFFSGFLVKGRINERMLRYLEARGRDDLVEAIRACAPARLD